MCKDQNQKEKVHLVRNFESLGRNIAVPDPYYDGRFDEVYDILDKSLDKFVETMLNKGEL